MTVRAPLACAVAALAALAVLASPAAAQQPAIPIPGPLDGPLPRYEGAPAEPSPLGGPFPPHNPALGPDGASGSGLAAGNGAASPFPGPLGHNTASASALQFGNCASLAFDARERLLALCNGLLGPSLRLIDPRSLATIASLMLPLRPNADRADRAGGTHFLVRADGSLLVPTHARTLATVAVENAALRETGSVDLAGVLRAGERPFAVGAGFDGRDWVVGDGGTVVALPRGGGPPLALALGEPVTEDLATDPSGTYVVTARALYRLRADGSGAPEVMWRLPLPTGSGTPPVVVADELVAVVDRQDPPRLNVVRIDGGGAHPTVCAASVLEPRPAQVEAHLVSAGDSIVVMNGHGYTSPLSTEGGATTTGGIARMVVGEDGCSEAWASEVVSPSAQAVVSRATGLLYTLAKPAGFPDAWYLAALDWRTGALRFQALSGEGLGNNSEGGAVVLGPDGSAYAGTFGGVVRFADR